MVARKIRWCICWPLWLPVLLLLFRYPPLAWFTCTEHALTPSFFLFFARCDRQHRDEPYLGGKNPDAASGNVNISRALLLCDFAPPVVYLLPPSGALVCSSNVCASS
jgi:hypothetical protein